ncbi:TNF receptor-associated factor 4-like [Dysidea avara]|uniref:TNF receptor-associated factor 4-like n=1 Tax=Dysidea avara TaxID=196820 RepID=UPI003321D998
MDIATSSEMGGYDYSFVDTPPDRLVCTICHFPSRNPYLTTCCGHVFCKSCLDNHKEVSKVCPVCREEEFIVYTNKQADREIRSLHVMCSNQERGCEWQGELNDINNHLVNSDGCHFENVKCSNECGKMLQRRYLTSHVETECPHRKIDCQYCDITGEQQFIEGEHKEQCPKLALPCPNKCEVESLLREDMEAHRKECPFEMVQCEYYNVGCEERMMRKRKKEHDQEKMEEHLWMTKRKLVKTEDKLEAAEAKLVLSDRLGNLEVMMQHVINTTGSSDRFTTSTPWPLQLVARVKTLFPIPLCPVTVRMLKFNENKENEIVWHSDPFYSHNEGYKLCLSVYAAGCGGSKGTHLSVFLCLMKGPHDDELTWPLREKYEFKLLNQISDFEHHSMAMIYDDRATDVHAGRVIVGDKARGWGKRQFISDEDLHKVTPTCRYLKDDCIFFQVSKL